MSKFLKILFGSLFFVAWIIGAEWTYLSFLPDIDLSFGLIKNPLIGLPLVQILIACFLVQLPLTIYSKATKKPLKGLPLLINRFMLLVLSSALNLIAKPVNVAYAFLRLAYGKLIQKEDFDFWTTLSGYFLAVAHSQDQHANCHGMFLFSDLWISTGHGRLYGSPDETISHITAIAGSEGRTTWFGDFIHSMLDFADPGHTAKALHNDQVNPNIREV
jgi:hypothetical protein